jgi:hypothetical protein
VKKLFADRMEWSNGFFVEPPLGKEHGMIWGATTSDGVMFNIVILGGGGFTLLGIPSTALIFMTMPCFSTIDNLVGGVLPRRKVAVNSR